MSKMMCQFYEMKDNLVPKQNYFKMFYTSLTEFILIKTKENPYTILYKDF